MTNTAYAAKKYQKEWDWTQSEACLEVFPDIEKDLSLNVTIDGDSVICGGTRPQPVWLMTFVVFLALLRL